jgi:hypothetical protein
MAGGAKRHGKLHLFSGSADEALADWLRVKDDLLDSSKRTTSSTSFTKLCSLSMPRFRLETPSCGEGANQGYSLFHNAVSLPAAVSATNLESQRVATESAVGKTVTGLNSE